MKIVDFKLYEPYLLDYLHGFCLRYRHAHFLALVQKGLLSGTATKEQIEQAMDRLSASVGSHIACLESQPMAPIEHPAVQALLESQPHDLPAKRKKPYSPEGLTLCVTPLPIRSIKLGPLPSRSSAIPATTGKGPQRDCFPLMPSCKACNN